MRQHLHPIVFAALAACSPSTAELDAGSTGGGSGGGQVSTAGGGSSAGGSTAGGSTAGGSTAGGSSAGGSAGGSGPGCAGRTLALCEDFEGAADGALPTGWTQLAGWNQGTVQVSSASAHGGRKALSSVITNNPGQPRAQHSLPAALGGNHWGRVWYRVETPAPNAMNPSNYFHITFVGLRAGNSEVRVVDTVQSPMARIQYLYNLPDDSCCRGSNYDYRYDGNWHCAEWNVNNASDAYRFFIDGTEVTTIGFTGRADARLADFTTLAIGSIHYVPSNGTLRAWIDDVAVDTARIGCQ